jgi:hypothetical protein
LRDIIMSGDLSNVVEYALAALALASLVASRRSISQAWRPGARLQAAAAQIIVTGGMLGAATFVDSQVVVQITTTTAFVALLVFAELSGSRSHRYRPISGLAPLTFSKLPVFLILFMWFWLYAINLWFMPDAVTSEGIYRTASGVCLFLFAMVQRYRPVTPLHFYSASLITISGIVVALPLISGGFGACNKFKCNRIDAILEGPFNSGNLLGLATAMCAALLIVTTVFTARTLMVLIFLLVVIYATMSRTSLLALGAAVGLIAVDRLLSRKFAFQRVSGSVAKVAATFIALCPMAIGMLLVFTSDYKAFSNRGNVWVLGREAVSGYAVTGRGLDWWDALKSSGYFGSGFDHFTHSEYLLTYFAGGIIGLALFSMVLYRITFLAILAQNSLARGAVVPLTFATCGIVETIWNPLTVDAGTWLFYAFIAVCAASTRVDTDTTTVVDQPTERGNANGKAGSAHLIHLTARNG